MRFVMRQVVEQQLLQAQRQLANLNAEQIDLSIQLMQALGGGFQGENLNAANASPASPPSSDAMRCSSKASVGLEMRL